MEESIFIYYTSDLHSYFDNWPKITTFLNQQIAKRKVENQDYYIFDNGDHMDRVNPVTEGLKGAGNIELLNKTNYDLVNIGNNEGITFTKDELQQLYSRAKFKVVCANLMNSVDSNPEWLKPYELITTTSGVKIAVIGLTAPFTAFYQLLDWNVLDPFEILEKYLEAIKQQSDLVVLLSHLGIDQEQLIAEQYPDIDVIIGGHTHHLFEKEEVINQSIFTAVGKQGFYVGEIELIWNHHQNRLVSKKAIAHPIEDKELDPIATELIKNLEIESDRLLSEEVVTLEYPLEVDWFKETYLIKRLAHTLKEWTNADVAMLNAGILLDGFDQGVVTKSDIHRNCPHPINPCLVILTGQELLEVVRAGLMQAYHQMEVKGYGFRGKVMGALVYADIEFDIKADNEGNPYVETLMINNEPLDVDHRYRLATADMFTFGQLSPSISRSQSKTFFMPEFIRDLLTLTLKNIAK